MLLQMAKFHSFLWLSTIPLCVCVCVCVCVCITSFFYWGIVVLQCCVTFYCTVEFPVLYIRFSLVIYFIHISVYMSVTISQFFPLPPFPAWCPYISSLHLCLYFCLANWFICTFFLDSTYMR